MPSETMTTKMISTSTSETMTTSVEKKTCQNQDISKVTYYKYNKKGYYSKKYIKPKN